MSTRFKKNEEEVAYLVECDEDMLRFRLTLISGEEITPDMFLQALSVFIEDYAENPQKLFEQMEVMQYDLQ